MTGSFCKSRRTGFTKTQVKIGRCHYPFAGKTPPCPTTSQAVHRLNGLLKTLKRKPQMKIDYLKFMEKVINKGHASPVPPEDIQAVWSRLVLTTFRGIPS